MIAVLIVAFFSGDLFKSSGIEIALVIVIEAVVVIGFYALIYLLMKGMKKRLAETYISVCENGICGICPVNGYKNRNFSVAYGDISRVVVKVERLFVYTASGNIPLTLNDAAATAALIESKNEEFIS